MSSTTNNIKRITVPTRLMLSMHVVKIISNASKKCSIEEAFAAYQHI